MFDFEGINEEQKQVILNTNGPVLVIAGPGTGKTFTLVKRIAYMVVEKKIKPEEIMVVTFTRKAARELTTRISDELSKYDDKININEMYIGTFHSICLRLLNENAEYSEKYSVTRLMDSFEQQYFVYQHLESFSGNGRKYNEHIKSGNSNQWKQAGEICRYVNHTREELADTNVLLNSKDPDMVFLGKMVERYEAMLQMKNAVDFSGIQINAFKMLNENSNLLKSIQQKIKYFMVDEYQDTNYIQEQLILLMAGKNKNICVVGDDDQGMYRFRGATIRNILEFQDKFEENECRKIYLNQNYRSEKEIVSLYNAWMKKDNDFSLFTWGKYRHEKDITAAKKDFRTEKSAYKSINESLDEEKESLYQIVKTLKANGNITDYNQIVFLFNSVKSDEAVEIGRYFEEKGIPVYSPRSDMFFERTEVKQIIGCLIQYFRQYLIDLKGKDHKSTFRHSIPTQLRDYYISCLKESKKIMADNSLEGYVSQQRNRIANAEFSEEGLMDFYYKLLAFEPFSSQVNRRYSDNVYETRAIRNLAEVSKIISEFNRIHNMHVLKSENIYELPELFFNEYLKCLYEDGIGEYEDAEEYAPSGCVSFMTIHQSKGLEFPVVITCSLNNKPREKNDLLLKSAEMHFNRKAFEPYGDIKYFDFWRLYYTAFSRAQNLLILVAGSKSNNHFSELLEDLPDINCFTEKGSFESIKDIHNKKVYSYTSHIAVYDECPRKYKFLKEYGFAAKRKYAASIGTLVHETMEKINNSIISGQKEDAELDSIRLWFENNCRRMCDETGYELDDFEKEKAFSHVSRYMNHHKDSLNRAWKCEQEITHVFHDFIMKGIVDLIETDGDALEILDYKTGPKPDIDINPEKIENYKKQLEIYAYLVEKKYGKKVSKMSLFYTGTEDDNPVIGFEYDNLAIKNTIEELVETVNCIETKQFEKVSGSKIHCAFCEMKYVCGIENV